MDILGTLEYRTYAYYSYKNNTIREEIYEKKLAAAVSGNNLFAGNYNLYYLLIRI